MKRSDGVLLGAVAAGLLWAVDVQTNLPGPRLNVSGSIPVGLYWFTPGVTHRKGDVVVVCLPSSIASYAVRAGILPASLNCASGVEPEAKFIAAISPDVVAVARDGVRVNGALWPMSRPLALDALGPRLYPALPLAPRQVLLMGLHPDSYDGRYYGSIDDTAIIGSWRPLLTWKGDR